ncbi:MAG: HD domain-containing protein [Chloracidobacterium sp.]|nr:HD domain-containing protein [Chloracidobacterium sp.]
MSERNYRDAVHNIIRLDNSSAEGKLIETLIDTVEFQRLRRIRQLGLAYFAYQSAEHSRFTHSLGAFHLATRTLERLNSKYTISYEHQTAVRVAALLHDIGHGAFSHVIESILGFHHEQFSIDTILSGDTDVGRVLSGFSRELAEDVAGIIRGDFRPLALHNLFRRNSMWTEWTTCFAIRL